MNYLFLLSLVSLSAQAYELQGIRTPIMLKNLQKPITQICKTATENCKTKSFRVLDIQNTNEIEEAMSAAASSASAANVDATLIGQSGDQIETVKEFATLLAKKAGLTEDSNLPSMLQALHLNIYKLADKGKIYFGSGTFSSANLADHLVFIALRLSKDQKEGEILTWETGHPAH